MCSYNNYSKLKSSFRYSGKDRMPEYVSPQPLDHDLAVPEGKKVYHGSCHCHAVRFAVVHDPLEKSEATDCNCTLCGGVSARAGPDAIADPPFFQERNTLDLSSADRLLHAPGMSLQFRRLYVWRQGEPSHVLQDLRYQCLRTAGKSKWDGCKYQVARGMCR